MDSIPSLCWSTYFGLFGHDGTTPIFFLRCSQLHFFQFPFSSDLLVCYSVCSCYSTAPPPIYHLYCKNLSFILFVNNPYFRCIHHNALDYGLISVSYTHLDVYKRQYIYYNAPFYVTQLSNNLIIPLTCT